MSQDPARAGVPSRAASQPAPPAATAAASASADGASDDAGEVLEKAYVAPQVLPKPALPTTPEPDAKVVLNLPASAVGAVSEEEVRAARARRRTATVKIDRAAVAETLGPEYAAVVGPAVAVPARSARRRSDGAASSVDAPLLPDGDDATPVDRHRQLRPRPAAAPAPVVTSRELEPSLDAAYTPPKSRSGWLVALGAVAVLGVGAWLLVAGGGPASTSSDPLSPTARNPAAPAAAAPHSTAAAARPTETAASTAAPPTAEVASPSSTAIAASSHAAASQPSPPVSTAATKPSAAAPAPAPRPVAKPVARPPKQPKGDIPSEI